MLAEIKKKGSFWTLGRKLTLVISVTVIIAFALLMTLQVIEQREGMTTMAEHDLKVMSGMMAQQLSGAVRWKKIEAIEKLYQDFTKDGATDLSALVVLNAENVSMSALQLERFAAAGLVQSLEKLAKKGADEPVVEFVGEQMLIAVPVYAGKNNSRVGTLAVSWSLEKIEEGISRSLMMQLGLGVATLIGLSVLMLLLINRMVGRPVGTAADVADKIASGDFSSRIDERKSRDELGVLMEGLKTMQANLKETIEADRRKAAEAGRIKTALDNVSANVMVADADHNIIYANEALMTMFREAQGDIRKKLPTFDVDALMGANFDRFHKDPSRQRGLIESLSGTHTAQIEIANRTFRFTANPVVDDQGVRLGTVVEWADRTLELGIENLVQEIVNAAQSGDLSQRLSLEGKDGFLLKLGQGLNVLLEVSERVINDTLRVLSAMAQGNLIETITADYEGSFGRLKHDANATVAKLTEVISRIQSGAVAVTSGAGEISQGTSDLSQRTEEQAASLEETASSMEQMTSTVKQNADNARQANQLASGASEQAEKGGQVVGEAVSAMSEISSASKKIADIIGVIDEIAFQTNLLALNAAVEAARAGEQGRGFAVVASEVRNLAQRSATAAKEIKGLIQDSVSKVEQGSQLVDQSGQTLGEIVTAVKRVSDIIAEIAAASQEQSSGIEEVNKAIMQMDDMTQQNAALVEQSAAAAQSMNEQAGSMKKMMDFFRLDAAAVQAVAGKVTVEGLDTAGIDFGDIRSKHLLWKSRLRRFLDGKESMSKEQAVSHKHCDLGKWLYSAGLEKYGHISEMQELEKVHKHLHEIIHRIVDFKHGGKKEQAEREYEQVEPISQQVVSLINAVERHVKQGAGQSVSQTARPPVERRSASRSWSNARPKAKAAPKHIPPRAASGGDDADWEEF